MANQPIYECTNCGTATKRDLLTAKKVSFLEMGVGGRTIRSRVTGWLCPSCVKKDEDYNREPFRGQNAKRVPVETVPAEPDVPVSG